MPANGRKRAPRRKTNKNRPKTRAPARGTRRTKVSGPFHNFVTNDPFRPTMPIKLTYTDTSTLSTGVSGSCGSIKIFSLNSLFDPDQGGVGHQPYGYDQLATLYNRYKVNAVLVTTVFTDPSEDGLVVAAQFQSHNNAYDMVGKTPRQLKEQPMSVTRTINNSGSQKVTVKQFFGIHTVSGLTKLQFDADNDIFTASVNLSPSIQPRYHIGICSDRLTAGASMIARTSITFYSKMYDRRILPEST